MLGPLSATQMEVGQEHEGPSARRTAQSVQRPVKVTGPAGRDGEGGLEPGPRVKRAGRALSAPRPRPHAAEESGSRGAGERGGACQTRGRGSAPLPGGRRGGRAAGSQACAARRRASQEEGARRIPGLAAWPGPARPPGAPPCPPPRRIPPLHDPAQPRGPPRPPPARRPHLTCPPPAAPAAPAALPPRALRRVLAPPLGLSGRSARWRSSAQPVAGPRAEQAAARVPPPHPSRVLRGARLPGALTPPDAPSPPRLPLRPGRALPAPFVRPPLSAAPAPDPDPGRVLAPPSLRPRAPGGPGSASGAHRRTEGRMASGCIGRR
ncbi:basic proline-rich protein-like [Mustela putorius furo]|uniref:Basic proline-rich protein-like n=1 Tax=Mustela putorius furo TaxID=9669 RepID=A0A8U0UUX1_MUSPF|nr:basic proline-rich protein-like [Mustela putorius furo]